MANLIHVKTSSCNIKYTFVKILRHGTSGTRGTYIYTHTHTYVYIIRKYYINADNFETS